MEEYWKSLSSLNKIKFSVSLLIGILAVVFATLNWETQEVHLLVKKVKMPLTLLIFFAIFAGYGLSFVFSYKKFRAKEKEIDKLKEELEILKNDIEEN